MCYATSLVMPISTLIEESKTDTLPVRNLYLVYLIWISLENSESSFIHNKKEHLRHLEG